MRGNPDSGADRASSSIDSPEWPKLKAWLRYQAKALLPETAELNRALADIEQRRRTKDDLAARNGASEDFDRNYLAAIGRVAEALLRMAGKDADAYRIHPSRRMDASSPP